MTLDIPETLAKLADGGTLTESDRHAALACRDLIALGMMADAVRRRRHGSRVTFLRVAEVQMQDAVEDQLPRMVGEYRIVGPLDHPEVAGRVVDATVRAAGDTPVSGFSLANVEAWCAAQSRPLAATLGLLRARGLQRIADAAIDELAQPERAFEAVLEAGLAVERITIHRSVDDWLALSARIESVRRAVGPLGRFAPLPRHVEQPASTGYDDMRQIAWARLIVDAVDSIQVDWTLHGPKLAQVALAFGVDDIDAVVSPVESVEGSRRTLEAEIRRNVKTAALEPVERDGGGTERVQP